MASDVKIIEGQRVSQCSSCKEPVSSFCRRCWVNLCDTCVPVHLGVKSKAGHVIVNFSDKYNDDNDTGFCESHPQKECSSYCKSCEVPICVECVSHESHEKIKLSDKIEELLKDINRENSRIQSFRHKLETILDHISKQMSSLPSFYQKRKDEVTERGQEWYKQIRTTVKKLHQELDDMEEENKNEFQNQKTEIEEMIENAVGMIRKATTLQTSKNVLQMQKFIPLIQKHEPVTEFTQITFPTFHECKIDENYLQTYFGFIEKMQKRKISLLETKLVPDTVSSRNVLDVPLVSAIFDTGFPANKGNNNRLYGMLFTEDKNVWMAGEGRELKLFDLTGNLHRTLTISCSGMFMCTFQKQMLFSEGKALKKISDDDTVVTMFTTGDWDACGNASSASGDLLLCLNKADESKVVRYSSTGTVLQEIQYDSEGKPLYQYAWHVTENVNGDIIITDYKKNTVTSVDSLGIFRYSYKGGNDSLPAQLATDSQGHVIVPYFRGSKIHMLDRDGRFLRYIIPEGGIKDPRALAIISDSEIIVGECITGLAKIIKIVED